MMTMMTTAKPASGKSIKFMAALMNDRDPQQMLDRMSDVWRYTYRDLGKVLEDMKAEGYEPDSMNVWLVANNRPQLLQSDCSKLIDGLKQCPYKPKAEAAKAVPVDDGVYKVGGDIFKVKHSKTGKQWAYKLVVHDGTGQFVYAGGPAKNGITPEHKLTYDMAKEFGALYGICCCCGRLLTNELSIYLGIGPVCGEHEFGGEFKFKMTEAKLAIANK